jgi:hypothetical protein
MHYNELSNKDRGFVARVRQTARGIFSGDFTDEIYPQQEEQIARVNRKWLPYAFCCPATMACVLNGYLDLFDLPECLSYSQCEEFAELKQKQCWVFAHTRLAAFIFLCPDDTVASLNIEGQHYNLSKPLEQRIARLDCKLDAFFDLIAAGGRDFMREWIPLVGARFDGSRFTYVE